jgi:hypothetical protein
MWLMAPRVTDRTTLAYLMRARNRIRVAAAAAGAVLALALAPSAGAQTPGAPVVPISGGAVGSAPEFEGSTAQARPIKGVAKPPRHPFMAPNGRSNLHDDAYQTDTYRFGGPLGDGAESSVLFARECGSILFDSQGRIVSVCVGLDHPVLALLDPVTLQTLAAMELPPRAASSNPFTDFSGGGYFYLDNRDRAVVSTSQRHLLVVGITGAPGFQVERDYDLSGAIPNGEAIISVLPDWSGRFWFVTRNGLVGTVDRRTGKVRRRALKGEGISNSFAVDERGGVFIVSDKALYRFQADGKGRPKVSWRQSYPDSGVRKPGQSDAGSGTTPTLTGRGWVAIADNADPMNIQVYKRAKEIDGKRKVCSHSVFAKGRGSTDQSLIGVGRSLIAENNYGYTGPASTEMGATTEPGLARVDVVKRKRGGFRCRLAWTSQERAPSVVPKVSLANGLVYTYTKPPTSPLEDPWYLTALDFRTGATVYRRLSGGGLGFNNNFAPVTLARDGTAYVGVLGGLVRLD